MKPIDMGRCINSRSNHSSPQKRNVKRNMMNRANTLIHIECEQKIEKKIGKSSKNNYSNDYIKNCKNSCSREAREKHNIHINTR